MSYSDNDKLPDAKVPSRLDKIKSHLLDNKPLPPTQLEMLDKYRKVLAYMCHKGLLRSPGKAIRYAEREFDVSYPQACRIVRDTLELWGDAFKYSKAGLQYLHYERFMKLAAKAEAAKDFKSAVAAEKAAAQIQGLFSPDQQDKKALVQMFQININRTTDPSVLRKDNPIDITPEE